MDAKHSGSPLKPTAATRTNQRRWWHPAASSGLLKPYSSRSLFSQLRNTLSKALLTRRRSLHETAKDFCGSIVLFTRRRCFRGMKTQTFETRVKSGKHHRLDLRANRKEANILKRWPHNPTCVNTKRSRITEKKKQKHNKWCRHLLAWHTYYCVFNDFCGSV